MKKFQTLIILTMMFSLFISQSVMAESPWKVNSGGHRENQTLLTSDGDVSKIYLGHCSYNDQIYQYDGVSLDFDSRVGFGIKLEREYFEEYIGAKIVAVRAGWDDYSETAFDCFVRTGSFNGETITSGSGMAAFGWNEIDVTTQTEIPDADALCVGVYTDLKKGVCSIPYMYTYANYDRNNCAYAYIDGDFDAEGNEQWINYSSQWLPLAIMLVLLDEEGKYINLVVFENLYTEMIVDKDETGTGVFDISNKGTNMIESVEVTTKLGELSHSTEVAFSKPIAIGGRSNISLPVHCFGTGEHTVALTKVNGEEAKHNFEQKVTLIGVPKEVSEKYTMRPVVEFYGSENSYMVPKYFDEYVWPQFELFEGEMTLLCQHVEDQFQIGNDEEELKAMIELCGMDSTLVSIPALTVNRSFYIECAASLYGTPFQNGIIIPDWNVPVYEAAVADPTFASVNIEGSYNKETNEANVKVHGYIEENILPEGEPLYLTVYLMEKDVESWDQMHWSDSKDEEPVPQVYVHKTVIREIATPFWGAKLEQTGGNYEQTYTFDIDLEEYNGENLYVMAHLNRGQENHHMSRQIINSAEFDLAIESSVEGIVADDAYTITMEGGKILVNGQVADVYNFAGTQILNESVASGIYIVKAMVDGKNIAGKYVVR